MRGSSAAGASEHLEHVETVNQLFVAGKREQQGRQPVIVMEMAILSIQVVEFRHLVGSQWGFRYRFLRRLVQVDEIMTKVERSVTSWPESVQGRDGSLKGVYLEFQLLVEVLLCFQVYQVLGNLGNLSQMLTFSLKPGVYCYSAASSLRLQACNTLHPHQDRMGY
jgi:hypothetical protein